MAADRGRGFVAGDPGHNFTGSMAGGMAASRGHDPGRVFFSVNFCLITNRVSN